MAKEYVLITFPKVKELMDYPWFSKECYLMYAFEHQEHLDSAYFVPKKRIVELRGIFVVEFTQ